LVRSLSRLQTVVGLRTEYNYLANTFKTYFSITLAPRPDKFYLIEIVDDPRGLKETTRTSTVSSERGLVEETTVRTSLDKLRFSLQFGKRIGPSPAASASRSRPAASAAICLPRRPPALSADLFDARSNERPRLQGRGSFAVYNGISSWWPAWTTCSTSSARRQRRGLLRLVLRRAAGLPRRGPEVPAVRGRRRGRQRDQVASI
jgi:hypothetical protein